ncbi:hypothetical protein, partial [Brucella sp. 22210]|uniref:hypothetical protein n=1 Tax=Brucella sp. 22210 TaxID=3453892 RepID=UPI003F879D88
RDIVITGNTGSGGMSKVVERYSPAGTSFSTTYQGLVIKDNPISTSAGGGVINPTCTEGSVSTFIQTSALDASFRTRVNIGQYLFTFDIASTMFKATFGLTQNDPSMADTFVAGYYYNQSNGYLHIKLNRSAPCYVTVNFKISQVVPAITSVAI